jgi:dTDP-glucose pyrophosphorylase
MFDNAVVDVAAKLAPSPRGELEITDVNNHYVQRGRAKLVTLGRGTAWLDTGTHDSLMEASQFVQVMEHRTGIQIACLEEIAWRMGYIDDDHLEKLGRALAKSGYGEYILTRGDSSWRPGGATSSRRPASPSTSCRTTTRGLPRTPSGACTSSGRAHRAEARASW